MIDLPARIAILLGALLLCGCGTPKAREEDSRLPPPAPETSELDDEEVKRIRRALERVKPRLMEREIRESQHRKDSQKPVH